MVIKARPKDRQSSTGLIGSPKKGGAGGKGTWGVGGLDDLKTISVAGPRDPNYDSEDEEDEEVVIVKTEVASPVEVLIKEFLASGDIDETIKALKELHIDNPQAYFIKKAIIAAMEKQAYERELVSKLLSSLYNVAVTPEKLAEGFQAVLNALEDVVLDTPDAVDILSKFLARAIIDEVVAPAFLKHADVTNVLAEQAISLAEALINQPFRSRRLAHVWGAGDFSSVKDETALVFEQFLINGDFNAAEKSVRELNAPHFHPQIVLQALRLALTKEEVERKKILSLLAFFAKDSLISNDHFKKGFAHSLEGLDELKAENPDAPVVLVGFVHTAKSEGWLDKDFEEPKAQ